MKKRIVSMLMLLVMCFSLVPYVQAEEEVTQRHTLKVIRVQNDKKMDATLTVLRVGDTWYAEQESLAELVGCVPGRNEDTKIISFLRKDPWILLCSFKEEQCVLRNDNWYVPLQEATRKTGLEFNIKNGQIYVMVRRTPRDMENLLSEIFRLEKLNLTTLMLSIPEGLLIADWELAKLYAIATNVWKPANWAKVLSGYDTKEQYEQILAQILTNGEDTTEMIATLAEGDEILNKSAKVSKGLWEILMAYPKLCIYLNSDAGENKELYESLVKMAELDVLAQLGSLGDLKEFLDTYKEVGDAIPLTESLKMLAFLELAGDANDALLHAMDLVFLDSENEDAKAAVVKIKAYHDKKTLALPIGFTDLGLRYINFFADKVAGETIKDILDGKTLFFNVGKILTKIETLILDEAFHVSDAADFIQYLPIYSAIQLELSGYYWENVDSTIQDMYDLRSCGIMYVKAVMSACENLEFDKSLKKTIEAQKATTEAYLTSLLSYVEEEYAPKYTNEGLIAYLQSIYPKEQEAPTPAVTAEPTPAPTAKETWNPSIDDMLEVGDVMTVGYYEQDNNRSNGAESIEWIVLDRVGDEVMLISRYALDCGIYNQMDTNVQWRDSGLRDWLNNAFLYNAFSVREQGRLVAKTAKADKNPDYGTDPGTDSRDRVTLLSVSEAQKYFSGNDARACKATMYAVAQGVQVNGEGNCWWWLRTPGQFAGYAAGIFRNGEIDTVGDIFYHEGDAIRPVIWLTLEGSADEEAGVNVLSSEERAWFESNFPYEDGGFISVSSDEFIFPYGDFRGFIFPETAQFYSDTQGIVLARVMEEVEILESQYASSYVKGLKVGDTIQLDEFDSIEIQSIDWQNGNCVLNDFYVLLAKSEDTFVYRMSRMRLCEYEGRGILTWIAIGNDTNFAAGEESNFDATKDSFKRYMETYDGRELTFSIWDDRCTWMYESGLT